MPFLQLPRQFQQDFTWHWPCPRSCQLLQLCCCELPHGGLVLYLLGFSVWSHCILSQTLERFWCLPEAGWCSDCKIRLVVMAGSPGNLWGTPLPLPRGTGWVFSWLPASLWDQSQEGDFCVLSPGSCSEVWCRGVKPLDRAWPEGAALVEPLNLGGGPGAWTM